MNNKWIKLSGVALMSLYLAACDADEEVVEDDSTEMVEDEEADVAEEESAEEEEALDTEDEASEEEETDTGLEEEEETEDESADSEEAAGIYTLEIEGMDHHYHTGELVELTAVLEEETGYDDWHWYIRDNEESEWEMMPDYDSNELVMAAPEQTVELRAALYDDSHELYAESDPIELEVDNH